MSQNVDVAGQIAGILAAIDSVVLPTDNTQADQLAALRAQVASIQQAIGPKFETMEHERFGTMVKIPAGEFLYGPNKEKRTISEAYWIQMFPTTVGQYEKFCSETGNKMPDPPSWGWDNKLMPMVNVTYWQSLFFSIWAGGCLPTEEQWEKAMRGTDGREYPWGNTFDESKCVCSVVKNRTQPEPCGPDSYPQGASPYGARHGAGNVWEWCANPDDVKGAAEVLGL